MGTMKIGWKRERVDAVPLVQLQEQRIQKQKHLEMNIAEADKSLTIIRAALGSCVQIGESMSEFRVDCLQRPRLSRQTIRGARFMDGVIIYGTIHERTEDQTHRLIMPDGEDAIYARSPMNVEPMTLSSQPVHYEGLEAIAGDDVAVNALQYLAEAAHAENERAWPDAFSLGELQIVRNRFTVPA